LQAGHFGAPPNREATLLFFGGGAGAVGDNFFSNMLRALLTEGAGEGADGTGAGTGAGALLEDVPTPVSPMVFPNPIPFGPNSLAWHALQ